MHTSTRARLFARIKAAAAIGLIFGALSLTGCGHSDSDSNATANTSPASPETNAAGVFLRANPNPVPAGTGSGTTTISWQTADGVVGEVYVWDGSAERLFARGDKGSSVASWIGTGSTEFRLYNPKDRSKVLARLIVNRPAASDATSPASSSSPRP
ncbi:MAG: LasA protease [Verrucomicrobiota bacterium]